MYTVYIEDQVFILDQRQFNDLVITRAVNDIGDVQSRTGDYSQVFVGAMINPNKLIFENAQVLVSGTVKPYRRLAARLEKDGNPVSFGYVRLLSAKDVFRVQYFGGNIDWFKKIGDKSLQDLDLVASNHLWTGDNVIDSRLNNTDWEDVYNYPNCDYGLFETAPIIYWYNFYPGVFQKYLLWKMLQEVGFNIIGDFWNTNIDLPRGFIPFASIFKRDRLYDLRNSGSWDTPAQSLNAAGPPNNIYDIWFTNTLASSDYNILNPTTANSLTILDHVTITFRFQITVDWVSGGNTSFQLAAMYTDTNGNPAFDVIFDPLSYPITAGGSITIDEERTITMQRSTFKFRYKGFSVVASDINISAFQLDVVDYVVDEDTDEYLEITPTFNYVTLASTLPDIQQKDLLVTFFNQYCLMCDTDHQAATVRFFGFNDVIDNLPNYKDWSNKLDLTEDPEIGFEFNNYAQNNKYLYAPDDENQYLLASPEFAGGSFAIDNENLDTEKVVFESKFSSIIRQSDTASGTIRMAFIPKFVGGDEGDCNAYIGTIDFETIHLITINGYTLETTQPALHELSFAYLIPTYHQNFINMLTYVKVIVCLMRLNSVDMNQLDFSKPVWIEYFGAYFYINLIDQYKLTANESTFVTLVRLLS
jgi:hypothetical protein